MTAILKPSNGEDLRVNWWKWRPTVSLLGRAGILPAGERTERCLANGCGGYLTDDEAQRAADHVDSLLAELAPDERILMDGERTAEERRTTRVPISQWNDEDVRQVYSADRPWLAQFSAFCRRSRGFTVI